MVYSLVIKCPFPRGWEVGRRTTWLIRSQKENYFLKAGILKLAIVILENL